ncbi:MAG: hypothetical protein IKH00_04585 [Bacteroidales bacterium]|nr:hypothetical protein [Bacteroidales bacterium]
MPIITEAVLAGFNHLCEAYSIPKCNLNTNSGPISLLNVYAERLQGGFTSRLEALEDPFPFSEIASLILQLSEGDTISVTGKATERTYKKETVSILKDALINRLDERLLRYGSKLFLRKGDGPDGLFEVKKTENSSDYSIEELEAIIATENKLKNEVDRLSGDAERKVYGIKPRKGKRTRRPDLGDTAQSIIKAYEKLNDERAQDLSRIQKYAFVFDFMMLCGYFKDKNPEWLEEASFFHPTEKYQYITNLLKY